VEFILAIIGLPFLLALVTAPGIVKRLPSGLNPGWLLGGALALAFALLLAVAYPPVIAGQGAAVYTLDWVPQYNLSLTFYLDSLSLLFSLIITGIGAVIFVYAGFYFEDADERARFMRLLLVFTGAMLAVVLAGNVITLFVAWELTSITSFLLIGFKGDKYASAREGALRALVVTGAGGLALLAGLMLLGAAGGSYQIADLLALDLTDHPWYAAIAVLVMLGAFTKSAQFPFHFWLPGAMNAPTPASAFLHSATMVKAGVYLLARLHPTLGDSPLWSGGLMAVGLTTLFISSLVAIRQPDLKGLLAFTTTAKLGALVALIGVPGGYGIKAALVGILAHALYKSALFLSVGSIDHATGTRLVSRLGGLWRHMPLTGGVVIVSALSMAGVIPLLGFVAKETMLEAFIGDPLVLGIVFISAALTAAAAFILIWDVFFAKPKDDTLHVHALPRPMEAAPMLLAAGSIGFGLLVTPLLVPLITPLVPVEFKLVLFPGFNAVFWLSVAAIAAGAGLFFLRNPWRYAADFPIKATSVYNGLVAGAEWTADQVLKTQDGKLRHYLIVVISVVVGILLYGGLAADLFTIETLTLGEFTLPDVLDVMLLALAVIAAWISIRVRRHLHAALALGIFGYAIGGVFLVEPAPDVALVQFLVETLATVVLVIMISRVSMRQRLDAMDVLKRPFSNRPDALAKIRDVTIAVVTGVVMGAFALVALVNRDNRDSIATWHLDNAYAEVGVTDVVSAILTDFRGTDTLIEIAVFATAALGLLALLTLNRQSGGEPDTATLPARPGLIATPMMRAVASTVMPLTLMIAAVHVLYGADAPGDGFTAGVVAGLGVALYYVVFGYQRIRDRLTWLRPLRLVMSGLLLALVNALIPLLSGGAFMGLVDYWPGLDFANLKLTTTLVFEIAIALTVFGSVSLIMETIAHPGAVKLPAETTYDDEGAEDAQLEAPVVAGGSQVQV
jgi:NADH:ubiquinone oxidoreductase subunit 5 (subunit L)/multisubunit Na+/H+ antiporter MnhA subunit/multisubunit Na+/H+ antiporter MnhB subunit